MNTLFKHILAYVVLMVFQLYLFNHITLYHVATPFVFLTFLFFLPLTLPTSLYYVIAFLTGLSVDLLSEGFATGLHAFSALLAANFRKPVILLGTTTTFSKGIQEISLQDQDYLWYVSYLAPLILIHHLAYFLLEAFSFDQFGFTLLKVLSSGIYTFVISYAVVIVFYRRS